MKNFKESFLDRWFKFLKQKKRSTILEASASQVITKPSSDTHTPMQSGVILLVITFGIFVIWAGLAPLDEGIPASGLLSVESKRKTISHLTGGIVKEIKVKEGDFVEENSPLIVLDDTASKSNFEAALQTFFSYKAAEARLQAEENGAKEISFPEELISESFHPQALKHMQSQKNLFKARREAILSQLRVLSEMIKTNETESRDYEKQLNLIQQELIGTKKLAEEGYVPRNHQLALERQAAELSRNVNHASRIAEEARLRHKQVQDAYHQEVETNLAEVRRDAANAFEKIKSLREDLERIVIRSPVKGNVMGLTMHTLGGVVIPGMKLMEIIPSSEKLIFEVRIPSHLIERVKPNLIANINLRNFPNEPRLIIEGKVISVSADLLIDPNPNIPPYFLALVEVTDLGQKRLGKNHLQAGMEADVMIKTGERTMLTYMIKPLFRSINNSLKEI